MTLHTLALSLSLGPTFSLRPTKRHTGEGYLRAKQSHGMSVEITRSGREIFTKRTLCARRSPILAHLCIHHKCSVRQHYWTLCLVLPKNSFQTIMINDPFVGYGHRTKSFSIAPFLPRPSSRRAPRHFAQIERPQRCSLLSHTSSIIAFVRTDAENAVLIHFSHICCTSSIVFVCDAASTSCSCYHFLPYILILLSSDWLAFHCCYSCCSFGLEAAYWPEHTHKRPRHKSFIYTFVRPFCTLRRTERCKLYQLNIK